MEYILKAHSSELYEFLKFYNKECHGTSNEFIFPIEAKDIFARPFSCYILNSTTEVIACIASPEEKINIINFKELVVFKDLEQFNKTPLSLSHCGKLQRPSDIDINKYSLLLREDCQGIHQSPYNYEYIDVIYNGSQFIIKIRDNSIIYQSVYRIDEFGIIAHSLYMPDVRVENFEIVLDTLFIYRLKIRECSKIVRESGKSYYTNVINGERLNNLEEDELEDYVSIDIFSKPTRILYEILTNSEKVRNKFLEDLMKIQKDFNLCSKKLSISF